MQLRAVDGDDPGGAPATPSPRKNASSDARRVPDARRRSAGAHDPRPEVTSTAPIVGTRRRLLTAQCGGARLRAIGADAARRQGDRRDRSVAARGEPGRSPTSRSRCSDLRRPGGDRDRERAPVQRDQGGARPADRDRRGAAGDQQLGGRHAAGVRQDPRQLRAPVRASALGIFLLSATTAGLEAAAWRGGRGAWRPTRSTGRSNWPARRRSGDRRTCA